MGGLVIRLIPQPSWITGSNDLVATLYITVTIAGGTPIDLGEIAFDTELDVVNIKLP